GHRALSEHKTLSVSWSHYPFTVGGNYGGTCLRGDESLVIKKESDIEPLIVVKK
ncbi:hypothetical protein, partial [Shigella flexneri]|uniref:hypothetical protein n=1 Tax=Shigella flexneri TaxID=623 RepID=UPI0020906B56